MPNEKKPLPHITLANLRPPYPDFDYFANAVENPFLHGSKRFEPVNAWWLSEIATLVYSELDFIERTLKDKEVRFDVNEFSTDGGTQCFVLSNEDFAVVAFRGTETSPRKARGSRPDFRDVFKDILTIADVKASELFPGANVHHGFSAAVDEVWEGAGLKDFVSNLQSRTVWFTGHSLGAALATLVAARSERLDGIYTFGGPRVGDEGFARGFGQILSRKGVEYFRFVNNRDIVTTVPITSIPPGVTFKHVGTLKHIDARGRIHGDSTFFENLKNEVRSLLPLDPEGGFDTNFFNLIPNALDDHVPTLYATHIWNAYVEEQGV